MKANASKHKAMSYGRMKGTEKRLREEVRRLLEQAEAVDEEEDARYGRDRQGDENDKRQMEALVEAIRQQQPGQEPNEVLADSGCCSEKNLRYLAKKPDRRVGGYGNPEVGRGSGSPEGPLFIANFPVSVHEWRPRAIARAPSVSLASLHRL